MTPTTPWYPSNGFQFTTRSSLPIVMMHTGKSSMSYTFDQKHAISMERSTPIDRTRIVQIRVIFELSPTAASVFLPSRLAPPAYFAYVEWFSPPSAPDPAHKMCRISRQYGNHGRHIASIIPLTDICQSVQLFPVFGTTAPRDWQGLTVLEECQTFYINPFLDKHMYKNFSTISWNF